MDKYYITFSDKRGDYTAATKAIRDVNTLCERQGMKRVNITVVNENDGVNRIRLTMRRVKTALSWMTFFVYCKPRSIVFCQHPCAGEKMFALFVDRMKRKKKCLFVALIHDLNSLRYSYSIDKPKKYDVDVYLDNVVLKKFDYIICHNNHMRLYLVEQGFDERRLIALEAFDYLHKSEMKNSGCRSGSIAIAGNLAREKSGYVYKLISVLGDIKLHLYGVGWNKACTNNNVVYHGAFEADDLPEHLEGDYGIVWDGPEIHDCTGDTGNYLRYNNPHKLSLYLSAGIPVIVWDRAAISDFVRHNNVGITVTNLENLSETLSRINDEEYTIMKNNALEIGEKISTGEFFDTAMSTVITGL